MCGGGDRRVASMHAVNRASRRSLPVPAEVDESKIDASFKKGVLYIDLPKTEEARKKVTHISVKAA